MKKKTHSQTRVKKFQPTRKDMLYNKNVMHSDMQTTGTEQEDTKSNLNFHNDTNPVRKNKYIDTFLDCRYFVKFWSSPEDIRMGRPRYTIQKKTGIVYTMFYISNTMRYNFIANRIEWKM